jgi:L-ascorbate metabolism protein UlaG (beta-lactamase superfamily)
VVKSGIESNAPSMGVSVRYLGGPTALIEIGGLRLLTDPTFDEPGEYPIGSRSLTKTIGPALTPDELGPIDAVLLSHDQHPDNLDRLGRTFLSRAAVVLSTPSARERLGDNVRVLHNWEQVELIRPDGEVLCVTGVPAQHGPDGSEHLVGEVTGFVLSGEDLPTVYVSGDNASLDVVRVIADRLGPFDVALLFAGAAQTALAGGAFLTLSSDDAAEATRILGASNVVLLHFEGWAHFSQGAATLKESFTRAGLTDRVLLPRMGQLIEL